MVSGIRLFRSTALALLVCHPPSAVGQTDSAAARADRYLETRTELGQFSGAVLIAKGGRTLLRKGYGYADVDGRVAFTPETPQEIASISKMFTAMAALRLRDQGRLRLDDSLGRVLPDCPPQWRGITIRDLIRHTSGIPDYEAELEIGSPRYMEYMLQRHVSSRIVADARSKPLAFAPGTKFSYSNTGYVVLGKVLEQVSGMSLADLIADGLLRPAGMDHSGVFDGGAGPPGLARGYTHADLGWDQVLGGVPLTAGHLVPVPHLPLDPPEGDAGMYSTVDDLYRWSRAMDGGSLVAPRDVAEVFTPGLGDYGFGWFVTEAFGRRRFRHNGVLPGHLSDFIKFPDDSITIVLLCNLDRARLDRIARDVTAAVLGESFDPPVRGTVAHLDAAQLAALEGSFRMGDGKVLTIRNTPRYLTAELEGRYTAGLIPLSPTAFYFPLGDGRAIFSLGADGRAERVNMRYGGEDHLAERIRP